MLGLLAILWVLLFPGDLAEVRLEQPELVVAHSGTSAILSCRVSTKVNFIHWYRHQKGNAPQRLLIVALFKSYVHTDSVLRGDKVIATKGTDGKSCTLSVLKLEKSDEGVYYCAVWEAHSPASLSGPSKKRACLPGCSRPGTSHCIWVPGMTWVQSLAPRILASTPSTDPLHRTLEAKEPQARRWAETQGGVQAGETALKIIQCSVSEAFGAESVLLNAVATSH